MAAYAALELVQGLISQFPIGNNSNPSRDQAEKIILAISQEMNGYLGVHTTTPVTTPAYFVSWLEAVNSWGAAAAILKSMFPNTTGAGENPAWSFWQKKYEAAIKSLQDASGIPEDLLTVSRLKVSTYYTRNPGGEEDLGFAEPFFKRD